MNALFGGLGFQASTPSLPSASISPLLPLTSPALRRFSLATILDSPELRPLHHGDFEYWVLCDFSDRLS